MSSLSSQSQNLLMWVLALIVAGNLIINYLWRLQLYKMGMDIIAAFQRSQNIFLTVFFTIPTLLIDPGMIIALCFIAIILVKQKFKIIKIIVWILFNAFGSCLFKAFYADPRPFWSRSDIESLGINCPQEYGNPSGHSWFSVIVGFGLLLHEYGPGENSINIYISLALIIFVPMSRMYLGAHSLNQVIQGLFLGFVLAILYQFCGLKQFIESYLKKFHSTPGHKFKKLTLLFHCLYLIGFVINLKEYNPYLDPIPENWAKNIIDECRKATPPHHLNFTMLMLNSLIVNFATGLAWGFEEIALTTKGKLYLSGNWLINQQRYSIWIGYLWFFIIQAGLLLVGFIPAVLAVYFIGPSYLVIFLFGNIGSYLAGFLYTSKSSKFLFEKEVIREEIN